MIDEYAMSPEFLLQLANQRMIATILRKEFGVGAPFVLAGYPESLGAIAVEMAKDEEEKAKDPKHKAKRQEMTKRIIELAADFTGPARIRAKRHGAREWKGSFFEEHNRFPFTGILSGNTDNPSGLPFKNMDWFLNKECPFFSVQRSIVVQRRAEALCAAIAPFLRNSSALTFVDPYFFPEKRFTEPYSLYFDVISKATHVRSNGERDLLIVCARAREPDPLEEFVRACNELRKFIPDNLRIRIRRIKACELGQEIHNRYILSDIGGISFGHGTDESRKSRSSSYDDITLLDKSQWQRWRKVYTPGSSAFDWSEAPIVVTKQGFYAANR